MADWELLYPGRFLNKVSLVTPKVIRITAVYKETMTVTKKGKEVEEEKVIIKYRSKDGDGEIPWNKTNAALTSFALDERDSDKWVGRLITVFHDPTVQFGKERLGGIRVCGSPEMKASKRVEIKRPRRPSKPDIYQLTPTDMNGAPVAAGKATRTMKSEKEIEVQPNPNGGHTVDGGGPPGEYAPPPRPTMPPREVTDAQVDEVFGMHEQDAEAS